MNGSDPLDLREIEEAYIIHRSDGIMHVRYKKGVEVHPELQNRMMNIFLEMCGDTKRPFMFTAMEYVTVTKEARMNAFELEKVYPGTATAVVADNTAYRLLANFYLKVHKPKTPYKVFPTEEKAVVWLLKHRVGK